MYTPYDQPSGCLLALGCEEAQVCALGNTDTGGGRWTGMCAGYQGGFTTEIPYIERFLDITKLTDMKSETVRLFPFISTPVSERNGLQEEQ